MSAFSRSGVTGSPTQSQMALRVKRSRRQYESSARRGQDEIGMKASQRYGAKQYQSSTRGIA